MPKQGEANRFHEIRRERYLACLRRGMRLSAAAKAVDMDRTAVWAYCQQHPEFKAQMDEAEAAACEPYEDVLGQLAANGELGALKFWLTNRAPDRWNEKRTIVQGCAPTAPKESAEELRKRLYKELDDESVPDQPGKTS
jgi:hypothetical protein